MPRNYIRSTLRLRTGGYNYRTGLGSNTHESAIIALIHKVIGYHLRSVSLATFEELSQWEQCVSWARLKIEGKTSAPCPPIPFRIAVRLDGRLRKKNTENSETSDFCTEQW